MFRRDYEEEFTSLELKFNTVDQAIDLLIVMSEDLDAQIKELPDHADEFKALSAASTALCGTLEIERDQLKDEMKPIKEAWEIQQDQDRRAFERHLNWWIEHG